MTCLPAALHLPLVRVGGRFMTGTEMADEAEPLGLPRGALYFRGRVAGSAATPGRSTPRPRPGCCGSSRTG